MITISAAGAVGPEQQQLHCTTKFERTEILFDHCTVGPDFDFGENIIYEGFYRKNYIEMILTDIKCK